MKKLIILGLGVALFSGCAVNPTHAIIYTNTTGPYQATSAKAAGKVGESETCTNILGIIATGNCSIANAAKQGNITNVSTVNWQHTNFLGIYSSGKTIVTGE